MPRYASVSSLARAVLLSFALAAGTTAGAQEITLGQVGPFTVIPVPDAPEINAGIQAYLKQANATGGVRGSKLGFFSMDDRYSGEGFVEQFGKAMEKRPVALLSPIGSAAMSEMYKQKLLDKSDVVIMNVIPGAESLRNPGHPRVFHIRAGDRQQIEKIVHHAKTLGTTRMAVLYQDLVIGTSGFAMAEQAAKAEGFPQFNGVKSAPDAAGLAAAAEQVKKLEPQAVLVVGAPRFMGDGVAALRKAGVSQSLFVLSYVPAGMLVKLAGPEGARGVGIAQTFPNPNGITLPIQREFQAAMKAAHPDLKNYTPFHLEGYLSARTVAEAIKRSKDKDVTPATLEKALRTAGEMDFGGYRVDFTKGNVGSSWVDIGVVTAEGKIRY
ncbi:ABC transporter substrate-binding protein [Ramlibacter sp. USB13]|uniref:ABC transporter substrate-binding protein n=1 Tax=Ramlibacter cellulosilyticus TaxID=2764187 RepID=A0A923MUN1_9BURK|nr:ABC transporter substrate-binding protein [Ramlibacter cellulosilyticus]MBC5785720.1 ABC transporter substrate-binding protein [Ramlibacter cellulosilyticus]